MTFKQHGVWESRITPDIKMVCNTDFNQITVANEATHAQEKHDYPEGIMVDDVEQLRNSVIKSLGIED